MSHAPEEGSPLYDDKPVASVLSPGKENSPPESSPNLPLIRKFSAVALRRNSNVHECSTCPSCSVVGDMPSLLEAREAAPASQDQSLKKAEAVWKRKMDLREREGAQNRKTILQYAREIKRLHTERNWVLESSGMGMPNAEMLKSELAEAELTEKVWRAKMEAQAAASEQAIRIFLENTGRATQSLVLDHSKVMEEAKNSLKARDITISELQKEVRYLKSRLDVEGVKSGRRKQPISKASGQQMERANRWHGDKDNGHVDRGNDVSLHNPIASRCTDEMAAPRSQANLLHDLKIRMNSITAVPSPHYGSALGLDMLQVKGV